MASKTFEESVVRGAALTLLDKAREFLHAEVTTINIVSHGAYPRMIITSRTFVDLRDGDAIEHLKEARERERERS